MTINKNTEELRQLLKELINLPDETEWVEFKHNNSKPDEIGEYISALANSAALLGKQTAYLVWGVEDGTHDIVGTSFIPSKAKNKGQELESWLLQKIAPKIHFCFYEFDDGEGNFVSILEIDASIHAPVQFSGSEFIRVGSYKKKLREYPEKERALWRVFDKTPFEKKLAAESLTADKVFDLLEYTSYFSLTKAPLPEGREGILAALTSDKIISKSNAGSWNITNLGAILFAKKLSDFEHLSRKVTRLILYPGNDKLSTTREITGAKGYAIGFEGLVEYIKTLLPSNEEIGKAFRVDVPMYPDLAIRELVANALIHQDFSMSGTGPMIEVFKSRMEITNPGVPLVDTDRFLDSPPQSRNEALASFMRRIGICEERGSGIDKVVSQAELYQLPAPIFEQTDKHTRVILFSHKTYKEMDGEDRIRSCYFHCCLKYVNREPMNNASVRDRFKIDEKNSAMASKVIKATVDRGLIKLHDSNANRRQWRYVPIWA